MRNATEKKLPKYDASRFASLDVRHTRDLESKAKLLKRQVERNNVVKDKAPHINYDFLMHPNSLN